MDRRRPSATKRREALRSADEIAAELSGVLVTGLRRASRQEPIIKSAKTRLLQMGLIEKQQDRFSCLTERGWEVYRACDVRK